MKNQSLSESVVFVVDDDASVRDSLGSLFRSVGLRVELFGSAEARPPFKERRCRR